MISEKAQDDYFLSVLQNTKEPRIAHSLVYYARSYLVHNTDFVEKYNRIPTLQEVENALYDLNWLNSSEKAIINKERKLNVTNSS